MYNHMVFRKSTIKLYSFQKYYKKLPKNTAITIIYAKFCVHWLIHWYKFLYFTNKRKTFLNYIV